MCDYTVKIIEQTDDHATVGGYGVVFGGVDLEGETFQTDTDFMPDLVPVKLVMYDHSLSEVKHFIGKTTSEKLDDVGVWVEAQLDRHKGYVNEILQLIEEGVLGWSSGSVGHLIERDGKNIKRWPVVEYSLTPTPAEPRTIGVERIKQLAKANPDLEALLPQDAGDASSADATAEDEPVAEKNLEVEENIMTDEKEKEVKSVEPEVTSEQKILTVTEDQLEAMLNKAAEAGAQKALKDLPAVQEDVKVTKDESEHEFKSAGEYFQAVKHAALYHDEDPRLRPLKAGGTGLSENVPADGGYLLAPQIAGGILENMWGGGEILQRVAGDPIGPNSNSMLYNAVDESSRATGSRFGGVQGYWMAEAGTITASNPTFRQMELKLKKVAALCYATDELLADATALESWLGRTVPAELRFLVEDAIYQGNGVGKPLGIMNAPCLVSPLRAGANLVDQTDIATMWSRRYAGVNDYVWLANSEVFPQLVNLTVGNFPFLLPMNSGGQGDPAFSLYGAPYIEVEYAAALGTTGDIMLASLSQYQTINKGGVQAASSIHVNFTSDETAFRFIYRIDGEPMWNAAVESFSASATTKSPFVVLAAASA